MLTQEELKFLRDLQKRLREGDHVSTAFPRYWGLKDYKWVPEDDNKYVAENYTGNQKNVIWDPDDLTEYVASDFIDYIREDIIGSTFMTDSEEARLEVLLDLLVDLEGNIDPEVFEEISLITNTYFEILPMKEVIVNIEGVLFLSLEEAQEHIKENYYHYTGRVYPYGYYAWRSKDYEKLMRIVFEGDFN